MLVLLLELGARALCPDSCFLGTRVLSALAPARDSPPLAICCVCIPVLVQTLGFWPVSQTLG